MKAGWEHKKERHHMPHQQHGEGGLAEGGLVRAVAELSVGMGATDPEGRLVGG